MIVAPVVLDKLSPRFRRIYKRLDTAALAWRNRSTLTTEDVPPGLTGAAATDLALGYYSEDGLRFALEEYGTLSRLERRGLGKIEVRLNTQDPFQPRIILWSTQFQAAAVDVVLRSSEEQEAGSPLHSRLLWIDWFELKHPGRSFTWRKPPLPGQQKPGISFASEILELVILMAIRTGFTGVALEAANYPAAHVYHRYFRFLDPTQEGLFRAIRRCLEPVPFFLRAWALELNCLEDAHGSTIQFSKKTMVAPLTDSVLQHFDAQYFEQCQVVADGAELKVNWNRLQQNFPWQLMPEEPIPEEISRWIAVPS